MDKFFERVWRAVEEIPYGKVTTYGQIAKILEQPHCSRAVGFALHANPYPPTKENSSRVVPCHRVVNRFGQLSGSFAFGGQRVQHQLLEKEGVQFLPDGSVDLKKFGWIPTLDP